MTRDDAESTRDGAEATRDGADLLVVVPTENHVEQLSEAGARAETRRSLFRRLVRAFLPAAPQATRTESLLAASSAFGAPRLAKAYERAVDELFDAYGDEELALRAFHKTRLRRFKKEAQASTRLLENAGLVHARTIPEALASALMGAEPALVARVVGARFVEARHVYDWSASDGAFFRALDIALSRAGGGATILLPTVDEAIDTSREDSPHDVVAEAVARVTDGAPRFVSARVAATWAGVVPRALAESTRIISAGDLAVEASACAAAVSEALAAGVPADAIGIALPLRGGARERALESALVEHGVVASRADGEIAVAPLVAIAFDALVTAESPPRATRAEYMQFAYKTWAALGLGESAGLGAFGVLATDARPDPIGRAELDAVALSASAWDALAMTDYVAAARRLGIYEQEVTLDAFILEATASLPPARDPASRRAGAVRVGTLLDFVGLSLRLLVIAGANEGAENRADPSSFEDDAVLRLSRERVAAGAMKVAACLEACEHVVLSFRTRDEEGGALAPAAYVAWLLRGGAPSRVFGASPFDPGRRSSRDLRLKAVATDEDEARRLAPSAHARAQVERERERFFLDATRRSSELSGSLLRTPALERIVTEETGGGARALSVTALERAAACAFVGYAECVAGAREKQEKERVPDPREEGNLVHAALAAAFSACAAELSRPPRERDLPLIVAKGVAAATAQMAATVPEIIRARVLTSVASLLRIATEDVEYRFFAAEQSFGDEASWPAHTIERNAERLSLRGGIDRVDLSTDGSTVRVIDYKRRKNTIKKAARMLGLTSLQVPLYARVASHALDKPPGESGFLPTEPKDLGDVTPPKSLGDAMARMLAPSDGLTAIEMRALDVVSELRRGHLVPLPVEADTCARCSHDGACRKPRFTIEPEEGGG